MSYDANEFYLSTMFRDILCGKENNVYHQDLPAAAATLNRRLKTKRGLGFRR